MGDTGGLEVLAARYGHDPKALDQVRVGCACVSRLPRWPLHRSLPRRPAAGRRARTTSAPRPRDHTLNTCACAHVRMYACTHVRMYACTRSPRVIRHIVTKLSC
jgi:hypothetical protein